jgi:hypothetical protein
MEPRIQYAKTSDGVSIAYAVFGEGDYTLVYALSVDVLRDTGHEVPFRKAWRKRLARADGRAI